VSSWQARPLRCKCSPGAHWLVVDEGLDGDGLKLPPVGDLGTDDAPVVAAQSALPAGQSSAATMIGAGGKVAR